MNDAGCARRPMVLGTCAALVGCAVSGPRVLLRPDAGNLACADQGSAGDAGCHALDAELQAMVHPSPPYAPADSAQPWAQVSVVAIRKGQVVYGGHFGRRYIHPEDRSQDLPVTEQTLFRVASISKLVVSVALMRLHDQGLVDFDADVGDALGWRLRHPDHPDRPLTLRLLMSHRSGLSDAGGYTWGVDVALRDVLQPQGRLFRDGVAWRRDRAPGTWFNYVNLNWVVIGTVMERLTGERFDRLMNRLVLQPLGLRGGFHPAALPEDQADHLATLYRRRRMDGTREVWQPDGPWVPQADDHRPGRPQPVAGLERYEPGTNGSLFGPQGSLRTSSSDLAILMQMLLNGGQHEGRAFLSPRALDRLAGEQWRHDAQRPNGETLDDGMLSWALGPQRFTDLSGPGRGDRLVEDGGLTGWGHMGDAYGLLGAFVLDPIGRNGMVMLMAGPSRNPYQPKGRWSSMARDKERVLSRTWRLAVQQIGAAK